MGGPLFPSPFSPISPVGSARVVHTTFLVRSCVRSWWRSCSSLSGQESCQRHALALPAVCWSGPFHLPNWSWFPFPFLLGGRFLLFVNLPKFWWIGFSVHPEPGWVRSGLSYFHLCSSNILFSLVNALHASPAVSGTFFLIFLGFPTNLTLICDHFFFGEAFFGSRIKMGRWKVTFFPPNSLLLALAKQWWDAIVIVVTWTFFCCWMNGWMNAGPDRSS